MIAQIEFFDEYGKIGKTGINLIGEMLQESRSVSFAHSVQDAIEWLLKFPLYEDATVDKYDDGRVMVWSKWQPYNNAFEALLLDNPYTSAEYSRSFVAIYPRNTIYEQVGYHSFSKGEDYD